MCDGLDGKQWFAWYPVRILIANDSNPPWCWAWLEYVQRRWCSYRYEYLVGEPDKEYCKATAMQFEDAARRGWV